MSAYEEGIPFEELLARVERGGDLLDQAAQAHAQAIVDAAKRYGYIQRIPRTIEKTGEGQREITDPGVQMTWLTGKTIPLDLPPGLIFRKATPNSMAAGKWMYPGRLSVMEQAAQDPDVQAVVNAWQRKIMGDEP